MTWRIYIVVLFRSHNLTLVLPGINSTCFTIFIYIQPLKVHVVDANFREVYNIAPAPNYHLLNLLTDLLSRVGEK